LLDDLPADRETIGSIQLHTGPFDIELERIRRRNQPAIWLFSSRTLKAIPDAFAQIEAPRFMRYLPAWLTNIRILNFPVWRWLVVIMGFAAALALASLVTRALIPLLRPVLRWLTHEEDDGRLKALTGPVRLLLLAAAMRIPSTLVMTVLGRQLISIAAHFLAIVAFAWMAMEFANIVSDLNTRRLIRLHQPAKIAMVALARRLYKIFVVLLAMVFLLKRMGVNVTAMLAGLGIGGVALALAAQKTIENVFGGISIIMSEAIRVGDFCKISGQTGIIEDIGLGTTRLRTLDRTIVAVPNSQISQLSLENFSMRDKTWFHQIFGLRFDTTGEQMRTILDGIEKILSGDPKIEKLSARVRFIGFDKSSLTLEIFAYILESNFEEYLRIQQRLLLSVLDVIAAAGSSVHAPLLLNELESSNGGSPGNRPNPAGNFKAGPVQPRQSS
jgi:MscS family membrane protein